MTTRSVDLVGCSASNFADFAFYKIVPHFDAQELRHYLHQVMAVFSKTGQEVVMVVDRSGMHRAHKLDTTFDH